MYFINNGLVFLFLNALKKVKEKKKLNYFDLILYKNAMWRANT